MYMRTSQTMKRRGNGMQAVRCSGSARGRVVVLTWAPGFRTIQAYLRNHLQKHKIQSALLGAKYSDRTQN